MNIYILRTKTKAGNAFYFRKISRESFSVTLRPEMAKFFMYREIAEKYKEKNNLDSFKVVRVNQTEGVYNVVED